MMSSLTDRIFQTAFEALLNRNSELCALFRAHLKIIRLNGPPALRYNQSASSKLASERRLSDQG
jgi:hypothetical protein